jgi:hypothetical protein
MLQRYNNFPKQQVFRPEKLCAITAETTLVGKLLGRYRLMIGYRLMV